MTPRRGRAGAAAPIASILEKGVRWRRAALTLTTGFGFLGVALLAAAPIEEVAFAPGEVRPAARIATVRHATGGEIVETHVRIDQEVSAGAPLFRLDGAALHGEQARLAVRRAHLALRLDRLQALLAGEAFIPTDSSDLPEADLDNARRLFEAERADLDAEVAAAEARVAERRADLEALDAASAGSAAQIEAAEAQLEIAERLNAQGLGRETTRLDAVARLADLTTRTAESDGRRAAAAQAVAQLEAESRRIAARRLAGWSTELVGVRSELAEVEAALLDVEARIASLLVAAPIDGRILELGPTAVGDAVAPGGMVAIVAPMDVAADSALVAEVRLSPDDIGHVRAGDRAVVEVSTFDASAFGEIVGTVEAVSAGALTDERGGRYFRATLALDRTTARLGDAHMRLSPGMRVTARLVTAETTVLGRLIEPVSDALSVVLAER